MKIQKRQLGSLTIGQRDRELKYVLAAQNKLHPALFSTEAEHKVVEHTFFNFKSINGQQVLWILISSCCITFRFCNI